MPKLSRTLWNNSQEHIFANLMKNMHVVIGKQQTLQIANFIIIAMF